MIKKLIVSTKKKQKKQAECKQ